ncbi:hypothetical protein Q9R32_13000 [Actinotalea sp. AC32]|nr:hypothetical protein [Actinotalea sp. AC32]
MSVADWLSPLLAFLGAGLGAWAVYRSSRREDRGRRFEAALDLMAAEESRQRALGRARVVQVVLHGSSPNAQQREALAVLREDVRASCSGEVLRRLSEQLANQRGSVRIADDVVEPRVDRLDVLVGPALAETAQAYVEIAGGSDAADDQIVALIAQAEPQEVRAASDEKPGTVRTHAVERAPLPTDRRLIIVKLSADATQMSPAELKERARKAWKLSLPRITSNPPDAVAAVVQQQVRGAWRFEKARESTDEAGRVEFVLGDDVPDLIGREFLDTGQNPVRYWP